MNRKPEQKSPDGERIAKVMARAGLCSRRDAETWIAAGRVSVNGKLIASPALNVTKHDRIVVDGKPLPGRERTRLFRYYKPRGLMTTNRDPEGRPTLFQHLPKDLPRVVTVGRLDFNSEGLLLLTNDGGLARVLELPATGWLRRYRVRAKGRVRPEELDNLRKGVTVEGISYGPMEATLDREQGHNVWLTIGLREGKNREVRNVLRSIGLEVNRLIRLSYGPFQLGDLKEGAAEEVKTPILREQISGKLAEDAAADFEAPLRDVMAVAKAELQNKKPAEKPVRKTLSLRGPSKGKFRPKEKDGHGRSKREAGNVKREGREKHGETAPVKNQRGPHKRKQGRGDRPGPRGKR